MLNWLKNNEESLFVSFSLILVILFMIIDVR